MKVVIALAFMLATQATVSIAQQPPSSRVVVGTRPIKRGTAMTMLDFAYIPQTLQELRDFSELIVQGTVESKMQVREHGRGLETDVFITVDRVVKGNPTLQRIVLTEPGGTLGAYQEIVLNNTPMNEGERYFFFLLSDKRTDTPVISGRNRYSAVCAWIGKAQIVGDKVTINAASPQPLKDAYNGASVNQFLSAILDR